MHRLHAASEYCNDRCIEQRSAGRFVGHHLGVEPRAFEHPNRCQRAHAFIAVHKVVANIKDSEEEVEQEETGEGQQYLVRCNRYLDSLGPLLRFGLHGVLRSACPCNLGTKLKLVEHHAAWSGDGNIKPPRRGSHRLRLPDRFCAHQTGRSAWPLWKSLARSSMMFANTKGEA